MGLFLLLFVVIAAIVAVWWYRTKLAAHPPAGTHQESNPFHAVTIRYRKNACDAVWTLEGKKFLANEAPRLPVQGCTTQNCGCRYVHYDDRRAEERRAEFRASQHNGEQRRSRQDRRRA
jgi:hypothetical protein